MIERSVLGAIIISGDLSICRDLSEDLFENSSNKLIARTILKLYHEGMSVNLAAVTTEMRDSGVLDKAGGEVYLVGLMDAASMPHEFDKNYKQLIKRFHERTVRELADELLKERDISHYSRVVDRISDQVRRYEATITDSQMPLDKYLIEKYESAMKNDSDSLGYRMRKFQRTAQNIEGIQQGLYIILADPNVGKTSLICNMCLDLLDMNDDLTVLFFSLDDSKSTIVNRLIAIMTDLYINRVQKRNSDVMNLRVKTAYMKLVEYYRARRFMLHDITTTPMLTSIESVIHSYADKSTVVFIDALFNIGINMRGQIREINIERANGLKRLSSEYNIPLICTAEATKNSNKEKRTLTMHSIMESGKFAYNADIIWTLQSEAKTIEEFEAQIEPTIFLGCVKNKLSATRRTQALKFTKGTSQMEEKL